MTFDEEVEFFCSCTKRMQDTFYRKRNDYGPTTTETYEKFGPVSMLVRMHDKMGRLDNLLAGKEIMVKEESITDTLFDLANYALITLLEMRKQDQKRTIAVEENECLRGNTQLKR